MQIGDVYIYELVEWKPLEALLSDSSRIGFAIALEADKFTVVRFSLNGRTDATTAMEAYAASNSPKKKEQGTRNETL
jgi:hypothetical protein